MAFPTTSVIDSFTRADTGPPPGPLWSSPMWSGQSGLTVISNQAAGAATWKDAYITTEVAADSEAFFTLATLPSGLEGVFLHARIQASGLGGSPNSYALRIGPGTTYLPVIQKIVAGVNTTLVTGATFTVAAGDKFGFDCIGTTLTAYRAPVATGVWAALCTVTDSTHTSGGRIGMEWKDSALRADDFGGGVIVSGATNRRPRALLGVGV